MVASEVLVRGCDARRGWLVVALLIIVACPLPLRAQDAIRYDFGGEPLIEHGDTLKLLLTKEQSATVVARMGREHPEQRGRIPPLESLDFLIQPDTVFIVLSNHRFPIDPQFGRHIRYLRFVARRDAANPVTAPIVVH